MCFVSGFGYYEKTSQLGTVCEESSNMTKFTSAEIWKQQAVLLTFMQKFQYESFTVHLCQSEDSAKDSNN